MRPIFLLLAAGMLHGLTTRAQTFTPIPVGGFNHDVVAESLPNAQAVTDTVLDATSHIMYSQGFAAAAGLTGGLPDNGVITDGSGSRRFQLAPYTGNNAITLMRNVTRVMTLNTPAAYRQLSLLCFSTEGASTISVTVRFTDGSSTTYVNNSSLSDWFFATTNLVTSGFGRITRTATGPYTVDGLPSNPRFYYVDIAINCADQSKQVESLVFSNNSGGSNVYPNAVFLALSGANNSQNVAAAVTPAICTSATGSATLTITGGIAPHSVSWNTTPAQSGPTASNLAAGSYLATITDGAGCASTFPVTITAQTTSPVTATASATPATVCPGGSAQLSVSGTGGSLSTYTWNPGGQGGNTLSVTPAATTAYTVSGTDQYGCSYTATTTVTVSPAASASTATSSPVCAGQTATIQIQNPQAGSAYNWFAAPNGGSPIATGSSFTTPVLTATTTYYIEETTAGGCLSARGAVTVTVNPLPVAPTAADELICPGNTATLNVANPQAGVTYSWFASATGGTALASGTSFTTPALSTNTSYYLQVVSAEGCTSAGRSQVNVSMNPPPATPVVTGATICPNNTATLSIASPQAGATYTWYAAATGGAPLATGSSYTTPVLAGATTYYVSVTTAAGCMSTARGTGVVTIYAVLPAPSLSISQVTSSSLTFSWNAVAGATGYEVTTDGTNFTSPSSGPAGTTHTVSGLIPGQSVTLRVRALGGQPCQTSMLSAPLTGIVPDKNLFVPNAFTPNGDGRNDQLLVFSNSIATMDFRVFNQWGQEIFATTTPGRGWDGTVKGKPQPVGVYVYALVATLTDGSVIRKKGSVNLVR